MEITEIRINLVGGPTERVKAFCTITLDGGFVIRDLKVIEGPTGLFLAMPSRKLADRCSRCTAKNHLRARYCNHCGGKLNENRAPRDEQGRIKLHADVAHPINADCRDAIQTAVVDAFHAEVEKSGQPGYEAAVVDDFAGAEFEEFQDAGSESRGLPCSEPPARGPSPPRPAAERTADRQNPAYSPTASRQPAPATARDDSDAFAAGIF